MKSIVLVTIVSTVMVFGLSSCKHGGDHPGGDHPKSETSSGDQQKKTDHPSGGSSKSDHPDHPR